MPSLTLVTNSVAATGSSRTAWKGSINDTRYNTSNSIYSKPVTKKTRHPKLLRFTGLNLASIPDTARIDSFTIYVKHYRSSNLSISSAALRLSPTAATSSKYYEQAAITKPTTKVRTVAKTFTKYKGKSLTKAALTNLVFDLDYRIKKGAGLVRVYYVYVKVNYTNPSFAVNIVPTPEVVRKTESSVVRFDLTNTNKFHKKATNVTITIPAGCRVSGVVEANGGSIDVVSNQDTSQTVTWTADLTKSYTNSISLRVTTDNLTVPADPGYLTKNIVIRLASSAALVVDQTYSQTKTIKIVDTTFQITSNIPSKAVLGNNVTLDMNIIAEADIPSSPTIPATISLPAGLSYVSSSGDDGVYDNGVWNIPFTTDVTVNKDDNTTATYKSASLNLVLAAAAAGTYNITVSIGQNTASFTIIIVDPSGELPFYDKLTLSETELNSLELGKEYTVAVMYKIVNTDTTTNTDRVPDLGLNYRVCVYNDATVTNELLTDEIEISNLPNYYGTDPTDADEGYEELTVNFIYNPSYPVNIYITGMITTEAETYPYDTLFTDPQIWDADDYQGVTTAKAVPTNKERLGLDDEEYAEWTVEDTETSEKVELAFAWDGLDVIQPFYLKGIGLNGEVYLAEESEEIVLFVELFTENYTSTRSIFIDPTTETITFGGLLDFWNLPISEVDLQDIKVRLWLSNPSLTLDNTLYLKNFNLTLNYDNDVGFAADTKGFTINGIHSSNYNIFMTALTLDPGTANSVTIKQVEGSDEALATRSNITPKEISIDFDVEGCDVDESRKYLDEFAKHVQNTRDLTNTPNTGVILLDELPNIRFEYIKEDIISSTQDYGNYSGKLKIKVLKGVGIGEQITTGAAGFYTGFRKTPATLTILATGTGLQNVEILEKNSNQYLKLYHDASKENGSIEANDIFIIDSEKRTVLKNGIPFPLENVDYNSDWFYLSGEYYFISARSTIQKVQYTKFE